MLSFVGIGGNLVSIQASRISTSLHMNCLPGEVPEDRRRCYNPCRTFFGSGKNQKNEIKFDQIQTPLLWSHAHHIVTLVAVFLAGRAKPSIRSGPSSARHPWSAHLFICHSPDEGWQYFAQCSPHGCLFVCVPYPGEPNTPSGHVYFLTMLNCVCNLCPSGPDAALHGRLHGPLSLAERQRPWQLFNSLPHRPRRPPGDRSPRPCFFHVVVD